MSRLLMPERRRHVRILTLKNFGIFVLAVVALFATAEVVARFRKPVEDGYGRIFERQLPTAPAVATRAPEVVTEGEIPDQTSVDPLLVEPAARTQYLGDPQLPARTAPAAVSTATPSMQKPPGQVAIVGHGNDVAIVSKPEPSRPVLTGGIFKQPQQ